METVEIKVYSFDELPEEAKEKALLDYACAVPYFWGNDAIKSIQTLAEKFNSRLSYYSIDWLEKHRSSWSFEVPHYMDDITEQELKEIIDSLGTFDKETLKGHGDCVLTGYCADEDAIDGLRKAYFQGERDIKELLMSAMDSLFDSCQSDYEYQLSEKGYSEHCETNGYRFTEDGELF